MCTHACMFTILTFVSTSLCQLVGCPPASWAVNALISLMLIWNPDIGPLWAATFLGSSIPVFIVCQPFWGWQRAWQWSMYCTSFVKMIEIDQIISVIRCNPLLHFFYCHVGILCSRFHRETIVAKNAEKQMMDNDGEYCQVDQGNAMKSGFVLPGGVLVADAGFSECTQIIGMQQVAPASCWLWVHSWTSPESPTILLGDSRGRKMRGSPNWKILNNQQPCPCTLSINGARSGWFWMVAHVAVSLHWLTRNPAWLLSGNLEVENPPLRLVLPIRNCDVQFLYQ